MTLAQEVVVDEAGLTLRYLAHGVQKVLPPEARAVIVVSARRREGRTYAAAALAAELAKIHNRHVAPVAWNDLPRESPEGETLLVIDGPALLEGAELLEYPARWRNQIAGALLLVRRDHSRGHDLEAAKDRLALLGLPVLGLLMTQVPEAPPTARRSWLGALSKVWSRRPASNALPTTLVRST